MIRQPPLFPQQNRPLPPWGRVGVGFACIPAGQCSPPKTLPICRQTPTRVISTTSTPESVNPTPALPCRGREPIGGNWGDRSRIPPFSGRFCDCGKMANATPTPALPRCGRWRVLQGRGRNGAGFGDGCSVCCRPASPAEPVGWGCPTAETTLAAVYIQDSGVGVCKRAVFQSALGVATNIATPSQPSPSALRCRGGGVNPRQRPGWGLLHPFIWQHRAHRQ